MHGATKKDRWTVFCKSLYRIYANPTKCFVTEARSQTHEFLELRETYKSVGALHVWTWTTLFFLLAISPPLVLSLALNAHYRNWQRCRTLF